MTAGALIDRSKWIFDLDGTLTRPQHDFDAIRAELGIPAGHPILEYLATLPESRALPLRRRLDAIEDALVEAAEPQPGCVPLLRQLAAQRADLGILTRNSRSNALRCLEILGVADLFDPRCVLGRSEAPPKPDPGGILTLLRRWRCGPDDAVMVGDFRFDLEAGRAAGVLTVHLDTAAAFPWPELADHRVRSLQDILARLPST
ncbi:MAG: HAD family hydrolase [Gammaproteobacteria bacterium]|nr:HAD family hydrolase [Gammaproteobacteria bacterium]